MRIKIIQMITGLSNGGSERNLFNLCNGLHKDRFDVQVVSLGGLGEYGERLKQVGINTYCVNLRQGFFLWKLFKLYKFIRKSQPDILQTWLYHADLIGLIIGRLAGVKRIVWNIRSTELNFRETSWHVVIVRKICVLLSFIPVKIINCSLRSIDEHVSIGYPQSKFVYIPNGYNLELLYLDKKLATLPLDDRLSIGFVARDDPQKDIFNFLNALLVIGDKVSYRAIIVGSIANNQAVIDFVDSHKLRNITLLGQRSDMLNVYNSFDILVLSSLSEAFPNVVAEAMACAVPCVVTDVGDAANIVGDTGMAVAPANKEQLAMAIVSILSLGREQIESMGSRARERIWQNFNQRKMYESYQALYLKLANTEAV